MAAMTHDVRALEQKRVQLQAALTGLGDLRPGSLVGRFRKCGKGTCHCARPGSAGHGPSWSLTRGVGGKTVTRVIPAGAAVEQTRQQIATYRRFRALVREFVEVNEKLCDVRLQASKEAARGAVEKGGSRRRSRPRFSGRSRSS